MRTQLKELLEYALKNAVKNVRVDLIKSCLKELKLDVKDVIVDNKDKARLYKKAMDLNDIKFMEKFDVSEFIDLLNKPTLFRICYSKEDIKLIDKVIEDINPDISEDNYRCLRIAVSRNNLKLVKHFIKIGCNVKEANVVELAFRKGFVEVARELYKYDSSSGIFEEKAIDVRTRKGIKEKLNTVPVLPVPGLHTIDVLGFNINAHQDLVLTWIAERGYCDILKELHATGVNIDLHAVTIIRTAIENDSICVLEYMLDYIGEDTFLYTTAINSAIYNGQVSILESLLYNQPELVNESAIRLKIKDGDDRPYVKDALFNHGLKLNYY